ncbi:MAG: hypothetical protein R3F31_10910 [Verrucomicrobiales bacterium]
MKSLITALLLLASVTLTRADTASQLTAVQAADDARVAAMRKPTQENLGAIFSDELRYSLHRCRGHQSVLHGRSHAGEIQIP